MPGAAFFDVDHTIIAGNTAALYARFERRMGAARGPLARRLRDSALTLYYVALYAVNRLDIDAVMARAAASLAGRTDAEFRAFCERFVAEDVIPLVRPEVPALVERHRASGDTVALLSASLEAVVAPIARTLGIDHALATCLVVGEGGALSGEFVRPCCFGTGKVAYAERFCAERGLSLSESAFYTDSASDLPLLARVGAPRVVNPDFLLRREAGRRGWPILDWGIPAARPRDARPLASRPLAPPPDPIGPLDTPDPLDPR